MNEGHIPAEVPGSVEWSFEGHAKLVVGFGHPLYVVLDGSSLIDLAEVLRQRFGDGSGDLGLLRITVERIGKVGP